MDPFEASSLIHSSIEWLGFKHWPLYFIFIDADYDLDSINPSLPQSIKDFLF